MPYRITDIFSALADPTRRRIIEMLAAGELPAGQIAEAFPDISRPAVARHMRVLRDSELVQTRRDGREKINRLNPGSLDAVAEWTVRYSRFWDGALTTLKLEAEKESQHGGDQ